MDTKEKQGTRKRTQSGSKPARENPAPRRRPPAADETTKTRKRAPSAQAMLAAEPLKDSAPSADVFYTSSLIFSRNRFILRLATIAAIVIALVFGISIFFKVDTVTVSGADKYTPYMVQEASGIKAGDNLLTLDKVRASGKIIAALPYVESVRIAIQLPDTVNIEITEMDVVYAIKDTAEGWWLITSEGRVVVKADSATAGSHTQVLGVTLDSPSSGQTVSGDSRLSAALSILQYLEGESIIGQVVSVDVTDLTDIQLWYGQQYQVLLGDTTELGYKISFMKRAIEGLEDYQQGILDVTFTTYPDQVKFKQFG